jgi:hypothetical protein
MAINAAIDRALGYCADAAMAPELWPTALDELAWAVCSDACMLLAHGSRENSHCIARSNHSYAIDPWWQRNVDWVYDIYKERAVPLARDGRKGLIDADIFTDEELRTSRFHCAVAKPAGFAYWSSACFVVNGNTRCLPFFRGKAPFDEGHRQLLAYVATPEAGTTRSALEMEVGRVELVKRILRSLAHDWQMLSSMRRRDGVYQSAPTVL